MVHHLLELWALEQTKLGRQGSEDLYQLLVNSREAEGAVIQEIPEIRVEELHTCLICQGEDKEGKALSLEQDKIFQTRYHYASCFYETGVYFTKYPPGKWHSFNVQDPKSNFLVIIFPNLHV